MLKPGAGAVWCADIVKAGFPRLNDSTAIEWWQPPNTPLQRTGVRAARPRR